MLSDNEIYDAEQQWDTVKHRREAREKRLKQKRSDDPRGTDEQVEKYYDNEEVTV